MREIKWMAVAVAAVAGTLLTSGCSTTCKTPVTSVPAAAQKTIDQFAEGEKIHELEMKKKDGLVLYKAEVKKADGSELEITVNGDGKLYKLEREDKNDD
jgi:outer membrane murein-binding lipoprotein Lpp